MGCGASCCDSSKSVTLGDLEAMAGDGWKFGAYSMKLLKEAAEDAGETIAEGAEDAAKVMKATFASEFQLVNDSPRTIWVYSGPNADVTFGVTVAMIAVGVAGVTVLTAGTCTAQACAAGTFAVTSMLTAVNCVEHCRSALVDAGYTPIEAGEKFTLVGTLSLIQTVKVCMEPPSSVALGLALAFCVVEVGLQAAGGKMAAKCKPKMLQKPPAGAGDDLLADGGEMFLKTTSKAAAANNGAVKWTAKDLADEAAKSAGEKCARDIASATYDIGLNTAEDRAMDVSKNCFYEGWKGASLQFRKGKDKDGKTPGAAKRLNLEADKAATKWDKNVIADDRAKRTAVTPPAEINMKQVKKVAEGEIKDMMKDGSFTAWTGPTGGSVHTYKLSEELADVHKAIKELDAVEKIAKQYLKDMEAKK